MKLLICIDDFKDGDYLDYKNCAISKALRRAGLPYYDNGIGICTEDRKIILKKKDSKGYQEMSTRVKITYYPEMFSERFKSITEDTWFDIPELE